MKNIFKLKKFKKTIIGISAISFGLSIGLTTGLISNQSKQVETSEKKISNNHDLLGQQTLQSFEQSQNIIAKNEDLKNDFKSQLGFYQTTPIQFSFNSNNSKVQNKSDLKLLNLKSKNTKNNELISNQEVNKYISEKIGEYQAAYLKGEFNISDVLDNANKAGWTNQKIIDTVNNYQNLDSYDDLSKNLDSKNQSYGLALHYWISDKTFGGGIDRIDNLLKGMAVTSAVAWVAAAGFWAAAWWFGISIPWAVAATSLAVGLTANTIGISLLKDRMKTPINKEYVNNWTSIFTKDAFINTTNRSAFDDVYDFVSSIENILDFMNNFETATKIISVLCSATSFAVPSSSIVQELISIIIKYIKDSIFSIVIFSAIKSLILTLKFRFS